MELTNISTVRNLLKAYNLRPHKKMGQNFLIAQGVLDKIMEAADIQPGEAVVEIGPGLGALTQRLLKARAQVFAIELDRQLLRVLENELLPFADCLELVHGDALKINYQQLVGNKESKLVANLPYYITTPLVTGLLEAGYSFERMVLMVQWEVAERMVAGPGSKTYGALSVFIDYYTQAQIVWRVSKNCFYPVPAVDSAVVCLQKRSVPAVSVRQPVLFFKIVRAAFGHRRKMLPNALEGSLPGMDKESWVVVLREAGIDPQVRGEALTTQQFGLIADSLDRLGFVADSVV